MPKTFIIAIVAMLIIACIAIEITMWFVKQDADTEDPTWAFIKVVSLGLVGAGLGCAILFACVTIVTTLSL